MEGEDDELAKLIAIATATDEQVDPLNDAQRWVLENNVKPGWHKFSSYHVYYTYRISTEDPVNLLTFSIQFNKLFKAHRSPQGVFFYLEPTPFDRSKETRYIIQAEIRKQRMKDGRFKAGKDRWKAPKEEE